MRETYHGFFWSAKRVNFDGVLVVGVGRAPAPLLPPHRVERVVGQAVHVKAVEAQPDLGRSLGDSLDVGRPQVERDGFEHRAPLGSKLLEEGAQRVGVLALVSPHDGAVLVIDHDGDVLVVPAVAQLD